MPRLVTSAATGPSKSYFWTRDFLFSIYRALAHFSLSQTRNLCNVLINLHLAKSHGAEIKKKISLVRSADIPGGGDGRCDMSPVAEIVLYGGAVRAHP